MYNPAVDRFVKRQDEASQEILETLRDLILNTLPDVTEEVKYGIPFYAPYCYLQSRKNGVYLSFPFGDLMQSLHFSPYDAGKYVRHVVFSKKRPLQKRVVVSLLKQAKQVYEDTLAMGINPLSMMR